MAIPPLRQSFPTKSTHVRALPPLTFEMLALTLAHLKLADVRCSANLLTTGRSDVSSFYDLWEAVTAVYFVCAQHGRTGSVRGLGMTLWSNSAFLD